MMCLKYSGLKLPLAIVWLLGGMQNSVVVSKICKETVNLKLSLFSRKHMKIYKNIDHSKFYVKKTIMR
jgi:hypothetical protein